MQNGNSIKNKLPNFMYKIVITVILSLSINFHCLTIDVNLFKYYLVIKMRGEKKSAL